MQKQTYHRVDKWNHCASPPSKRHNPEDSELDRNISPFTLRSDNSMNSLKKFQRKNNNTQNKLFKEIEKKSQSPISNNEQQLKNILINYEEKISEKKPVQNAKQIINAYSFIPLFKSTHKKYEQSVDLRNQTFSYGKTYRSKAKQKQNSLTNQQQLLQTVKCKQQDPCSSAKINSNKEKLQYKVNTSLMELNKQLQKQIKTLKTENNELKDQLAVLSERKICSATATNTDRSSQQFQDNIKTKIIFSKSEQEHCLEKIIRQLQLSLKESKENCKKLEINNAMLLKKINSLERDRKADELKLKFLKYIKIELKQTNYKVQDLEKQNDELKKKLKSLKNFQGKLQNNDCLKKQQSGISTFSNLLAGSISMELSVQEDDILYKTEQIRQKVVLNYHKSSTVQRKYQPALEWKQDKTTIKIIQ